MFLSTAVLQSGHFDILVMLVARNGGRADICGIFALRARDISWWISLTEMHHAMAKYRGEVAEEQHAAVTEWSKLLTAKVAPIEQQASTIPERMQACLREGKAAFATGARFSMSCGLPSWQQLVTDVFGRMLAGRQYQEEEIESTLRAVKFADDLLAVAQTLTSILDEADVAALVASRLYSGSRSVRHCSKRWGT